MANKTKNYGFAKPLPEEFYDVNVQNENLDKIDEELAKANEIFIAEVDVTPFEEVRNAIETGKIVFCKKGGWVLPLTSVANGPMYGFTGFTFGDTVNFKQIILHYQFGWRSNDENQRMYTYSTDDLVENESTLRTGQLHFVYE